MKGTEIRDVNQQLPRYFESNPGSHNLLVIKRFYSLSADATNPRFTTAGPARLHRRVPLAAFPDPIAQRLASSRGISESVSRVHQGETSVGPPSLVALSSVLYARAIVLT